MKPKFSKKLPTNDNDDLLTIKRVVRNEGEKVPLTISKNQLKKIKPEGHFEGKNKVFFDDDGNVVTAEKHRLKQRLSANKETANYDAIRTMEDRLEQNRDDDDEIERERRKIKRKKKDVAKEIARRGGEQREAVLDNGSDNDEEE